jgi:YD repeat-containing protein
VSIDARGNPSTSRTVVDRDTATVYQLAYVPDSTVASLSVTVNGLRQSSRSSHNLTTTYAYDALGRMVSMQDARGGVYSRGYDERGRVAWESDPATNGTWYAYDALGRQIAVTNALGHVVETAYDAEDRVIATWGATYPVEYDYDAYGRMTAMRTFRDEEGAGDETRWLYEDATGVLTNKVYADGKGTAYTYTAAGKLATRTWARGSVASYAYDATGQLTGIDYSDTTPDVSFTYDRLGRQLSAIAAGVSTNLYEYDGLDLVAETQNGIVIDRATDSLGRAAGFSVAGVGDPGSPYAVSYGYDAYGL